MHSNCFDVGRTNHQRGTDWHLTRLCSKIAGRALCFHLGSRQGEAPALVRHVRRALPRDVSTCAPFAPAPQHKDVGVPLKTGTRDVIVRDSCGILYHSPAHAGQAEPSRLALFDLHMHMQLRNQSQCAALSAKVIRKVAFVETNPFDPMDLGAMRATIHNYSNMANVTRLYTRTLPKRFRADPSHPFKLPFISPFSPPSLPFAIRYPKLIATATTSAKQSTEGPHLS